MSCVKPVARRPEAPLDGRLFSQIAYVVDTRYVDPLRIDPGRMLFGALDGMQQMIPALLVEHAAGETIVMSAGSHRLELDTNIGSMRELALVIERCLSFVSDSLGSELDASAVEYAASNGMLATLDEQSRATPRGVAPPVGPAGVGVSIRERADQIFVVTPVAAGPAARAGIRVGDRILAVDRDSTDGLTSQDVVDRLRGAPGSRVELVVERAGEPAPLRFTLKRTMIWGSSVRASMVGDGVGVLRITELTASTSREIAAARNKLSARAWILDLRGNRGGLLEQAIQVASQFIAAGPLITVRSRDGREVRSATPVGADLTSPMIVLIDGATAAGAEIVASALQERDRAVIAGVPSAGATAIRELYNTGDGGELSLTVAAWQSPGGRAVSRVVPDLALRAPSHLILGGPARDEEGDQAASDVELARAARLLSAMRVATRGALLADAGARAQLEAEIERDDIAAFEALGVDWTAAPLDAPRGARLEAKLEVPPSAQAGDRVTLTATVRNTGSAPAWRAVVVLHAADGELDGAELPIGRLAAGETRAFTAQVQIPQSAHDRIDRLELSTRAQGIAVAPAGVSELRIVAAPRPELAYTYQLVDDGNGDGLVQRGEAYHLRVTLKNVGAGRFVGLTTILRNASGQGVFIERARIEIGALEPGAGRTVEFPLRVTADLRGGQLSLDWRASDASLGAEVTEHLHAAVVPALSVAPAHGSVVVHAKAELHAGASANTALLGWANRGAAFSVLGTAGAWTKIELAGQPAFVVTAATEPGSGAPAFTPHWAAIPPTITLAPGALQVTRDHVALRGALSHTANHTYVLVTNRDAHIVNRKVYYRANTATLDASIPLWPGSNEVTVVARGANAESRRTVVVAW